MTPAEIHNALLTQPRLPHVLRLTSGDKIAIPHIDFVMFPAESLQKDWFLVVRPEGGFVMVDAASVAALEIPERPKAA